MTYALAPRTPLPALSVQDRVVLELARRSTDRALHLGVVMILDGRPPALDQLVAQLRSRLPAMPELALRIGGQARRPRWEEDPDFDLARHVHELRLPADSARYQDEAMEAVLDQPLPRDRPLWGVWLITGRGGGWALAYKAHHAFQDGGATVRTIAGFFGPAPAAPDGPSSLPPTAEEPPAQWNAAVIKDMLPPLRRTTRWSALDAPLSGRRTVVTTDVALSRLHAIGRARRASVNQIALAAVAGTVRAWHPQDWTSADRDLRATLATNIRAPHEPLPLLGNKAAIANVRLPCGEAESLRRLDQLKEEVTHARLSELARRHRLLFQKLPYWCGKMGIGRSIDPRFTPLTLADVRARGSMSFGGQPVRGFYPMPVSVPGQPLFIAWSVHAGMLHTTFLADAAVPDTEDLARHWQRAVDELEEECAVAAPATGVGAALR